MKKRKPKKIRPEKIRDTVKIPTNYQKRSIVSWLIFLFSLSILLISLVPVFFPALIATINEIQIPGIQSVSPNPFELGVWAVSLLITNLLIFALAIFYFKNKLPRTIKKTIDFIFNFEVSKNVTLLILISLLTIYISFSVVELSVQEKWDDYERLIIQVEDWKFEQITKTPLPHVKYFLLNVSLKLFENYSVVPFLASILLLITTYFITRKISGKRFAGIVSMLIVLQSNLFLTYDTSVTYSNFWVLFYIISLYLVYKFWPLSPVAYLLSIPSKSLTILFLPLSLFFIWRSNISNRRKIVTGVVISIIVLMVGLFAASMSNQPSINQPQQEIFDYNDFWIGFASFAYQLRFDGLVILFIIPLIVGLFIASRNGIKAADSIMVLIAGMLLIAPILTGFTDQTNQPYRFVPLIVFFAIGVGMLLSKREKTV